jgi:hypothetical protein
MTRIASIPTSQITPDIPIGAYWVFDDPDDPVAATATKKISHSLLLEALGVTSGRPLLATFGDTPSIKFTDLSPMNYNMDRAIDYGQPNGAFNPGMYAGVGAYLVPLTNEVQSIGPGTYNVPPWGGVFECTSNATGDVILNLPSNPNPYFKLEIYGDRGVLDIDLIAPVGHPIVDEAGLELSSQSYTGPFGATYRKDSLGRFVRVNRRA